MKLIAIGGAAATAYVSTRILKYMASPRKNVEHFKNHPQKPPYKDLLRSAVFSQMAYMDPENVRSGSVQTICPVEFKDFVNGSINYEGINFYDASILTKGIEDTQAYMWIKDRTAYICFRGTEDAIDAMADLDVRTKDFESTGVKIHNGFYEQFQAIEKNLTADLYEHKDQYDKIIITGHSLGASLSSISAGYLGGIYPDKKVITHTFGSPRVGNVAFGQMYNDSVHEHWRVYNIDDPVSMIPMSHRFCHIDNNSLCLGNRPGAFDVHNKDAPWYSRLFISLVNLKYFGVIEPHSCELYVRKLAELALRDDGQVPTDNFSVDVKESK